MAKFLTTPAASVVLLLALTGVLIAVGVYVVGKVRRDLTSDSDGANQLLSNFREMHSQGGLSDQEYRTIKAMLAERLEHELRGSGKDESLDSNVESPENNVECPDSAGNHSGRESNRAKGPSAGHENDLHEESDDDKTA